MRNLEILVVDDDDADALMIEEALGSPEMHTTVTRVADGREALDYLHRVAPYTAATRPDLILLDLNLPRKNGFEVLRELKLDADHRRIPVVMLTTSSAQEDIRRSYELYANSYTTKPATLPEFVDFVQSLEQYWVRSTHLPPKDVPAL